MPQYSAFLVRKNPVMMQDIFYLGYQMDPIKQISAFVGVATKGSLSAAARLEGVTPAIQVRVSDTGVGIPADRLARIFDPFYTTKEKGLGMGMAIAHRIIEDHKGTVDVESALGAGTTFTLCFPVRTGL